MSGRILITTSSFAVEGNAALAALTAAGCEIVLNPYKRKLTESEISTLMDEHRPIGMVAGIEPLTAAVMDAAPSLAVISRCGTGLDSVDLGAAEARRIVVRNTPGAPTVAVAELAVGMILATLRHIAASDRLVRAVRFEKIMGGLLSGKAVGIVGYGRIGRAVAERLRPFGATILACDVAPCADDGGVTWRSLDALLAEADIVSLHTPGVPGDAALIGAAELARMKKGAILVNLARGDLVDEQALADALACGHLAGAALDVFAEEPYAGQLTAIDTVVLTPHIGSYAREGRAMMEAEAADNLLAELKRLGLVP